MSLIRGDIAGVRPFRLGGSAGSAGEAGGGGGAREGARGGTRGLGDDSGFGIQGQHGLEVAGETMKILKEKEECT